MIGWREEAGVLREDCAHCGGEHVTEASLRACEARQAAPGRVAPPRDCPHCGEVHTRQHEFAPWGCDPQALFRRTHRCAEPRRCRAWCHHGQQLALDDPGDRPARVALTTCTRCGGSGFEPQEVSA